MMVKLTPCPLRVCANAPLNAGFALVLCHCNLCLGIKVIKLKCFMEFTGMAFPGSSALDGTDKGSEGAVRLQDMEWLSSLSEPELDFLISLKELATRRAKNVGYKDLGDRFDLRMLRALGFVLLEFFKERVQSTSELPDSAEILRSLNQCGLSFLKSGGKSDPSAERTDALAFVTPLRKRMWDGLCEETTKSHKRQKTEDIDR